MTYDFDFFISHASEDKSDVVLPLADALTSRGFRVWVDKGELTVGDRLLRRINEGISRSRFGIVVLSPSFFQKNWPQWELEGLMALEDARGRKLVLPVRHRMTHTELAEIAPILAGRVSLQTVHGLADVVDGVCAAAKMAGTTLEDADLGKEPLDLYADAEEGYTAGIAATQELITIREAFTESVLAYNTHNAELARLGKPMSKRALRSAINAIVPHMLKYATDAKVASANMKHSYRAGFLSLAQGAALDNPSLWGEFRRKHADRLRQIVDVVVGARDQTAGMRTIVDALPTYAADFKRGKRQAADALTASIDAMDSVIEDVRLAIEMLTPSAAESE